MVTKYQKFGDGYKAEAVKLYRESNQTIAETARNLGLKESTLANWVKKDKDNEAVAAGEAPLTPAERTRIRELEADVRRPQHGERVPEKSECVLREPEPVKFTFIGQVAEEQRQLPPGVRFPVVFMCRMLEVTRQGFYEWKKRPVSAHDQKDAELAARIRYLHQERHEDRAGIERILWDLQEEGYVTSGRRVRRLPGAGRGPAVRASGPSARTTVQDSEAIGGLVDLVEPPVHRPGAGPAVGRRYHLYLDVFWLRVPGDAYRHVLE